MTIRCLQLEGRLSSAVIHSNLVYRAGQTADLPRQIDALLSCPVFLADMNNVAAMNKARDAWLDTDNSPARATMAARLVDPRWPVEITGIAALP
jgi:enamine deaminase RidA (YjgF/YER057c/UK114 family)